MREAQLKKQQEEMIKQQEQKRREAEREQLRKYVEFHIYTDTNVRSYFLCVHFITSTQLSFHREQQAIAARKERENLRILAETKQMQEQLRANQRAAVEKQKHKMYYSNNAYNFDMLDSGDSTDTEEKESRKRPPIPEWSLKENRIPRIQDESRINSKCIDSFFSVEPRQVDLREIFPNIDDKHLRRNSSAIWHTPPRYSMMPKY